MSPLFIFLLIKLMSPFVSLFDLPSMHLSLTNWDLVVSGFVERDKNSVMILKMNNEPPGWDVAYERILTLDPDDGDILGQVVEPGASYLIGVTPELIWVWRGSVKMRSVDGYSLPELDHVYELDDLLDEYPSVADMVDDVWADGMSGKLRIKALDGYYYSLTPARDRLEKLTPDPPKRAPTIISSWKGCRLDYHGTLIDFRGCKRMFVDGDEISLETIKSKATHYFVVGRKNKDGGFLWRVSDQEMFGDLDDDDPLRYLRFVTLFKGKILLLAEDGKGVDDVYAAAIDVKDGHVVWTKTFW